MTKSPKWTLVVLAAAVALILATATVWASTEGPGAGKTRAKSEIGPAQAALLQEPEVGEPGRGARRNAQAFADQFKVGIDEVMALQKQGIGFGSIVKLYALASVKGVAATTLASQLRGGGDNDIDWDTTIASLSPGEKSALDELGLKGMGHLKKAAAVNCPPGHSKQGRC